MAMMASLALMATTQSSVAVAMTLLLVAVGMTPFLGKTMTT
jgi:hypothetical protein